MFRKLVLFLCLSLLLGGVLSACNTLEGIGRDTRAAGSAIEGAAHRSRSY
jgi:predicted small secreted protein